MDLQRYEKKAEMHGDKNTTLLRNGGGRVYKRLPYIFFPLYYE